MKTIPYIHITPQQVVVVSGILATAGAITGVSKAGNLERKINYMIDGVNNFLRMTEVLSQNPFDTINIK